MCRAALQISIATLLICRAALRISIATLLICRAALRISIATLLICRAALRISIATLLICRAALRISIATLLICRAALRIAMAYRLTTGADPGILERGYPPCERRRRRKKTVFFAPNVRTKLKSECQISVFLASGTKIQGLIVSLKTKSIKNTTASNVPIGLTIKYTN